MYKNIFSSIKLIDPTLKEITVQNETIDISDQFLSSVTEFTSKFKEVYKCSKLSRVYISHKIKSAIPIFVLKYGTEFTSKFKEVYKCPKLSRVYISHRIKSAIPIFVLKYGKSQQLSYVFDTLVTNGAYFSHNEFKVHKEYSILFFTHINPKFTLRDNL